MNKTEKRENDIDKSWSYTIKCSERTHIFKNPVNICSLTVLLKNPANKSPILLETDLLFL
jgi:hypothetical protein